MAFQLLNPIVTFQCSLEVSVALLVTSSSKTCLPSLFWPFSWFSSYHFKHSYSISFKDSYPPIIPISQWPHLWPCSLLPLLHTLSWSLLNVTDISYQLCTKFFRFLYFHLWFPSWAPVYTCRTSPPGCCRGNLNSTHPKSNMSSFIYYMGECYQPPPDYSIQKTWRHLLVLSLYSWYSGSRWAFKTPISRICAFPSISSTTDSSGLHHFSPT